MACNLCHEPTGHKDSCPTLIPVLWESSGSAWETLARTLFDALVSAEQAAIVDRGSAEDKRRLDEFVQDCKRAFDDGDAYGVIQLLRIREG